jgi:cyanate permease
MFVRFFFVVVTVIVTGFFGFLWTPLEMPFRTTFIIGIITFSAAVVYEIGKQISLYDKTKIRGF